MIATSVTSSHLDQLSYAITPEEICSLGSKLNYTAFKLYLYFKTQQQAENGAIRFQASEIMERLGICRSTLRKAMAALEGLLPFRFKPVREWELQFQAEEAELEAASSTEVITAQESLVESIAVAEVVATLETTSQQADSDSEYSTQTEEIEPEEYCEEVGEKQAEKAWEDRILQEAKEKMIVAETLENLRDLKRLYGSDLTIAAWHLLNPEEQARVKAIAERDLQNEASGATSTREYNTPTTEILQPGVAIEIWQNGVWLGGYRYLGQGDSFIGSERTHNLEIAHEVEDGFGQLYKLAKSDLRLKESS